MEEEDDDMHERPTLPAPPPVSLRFETPVEQFFTAGVATDDEDLLAWWAAQRRRAHTSWVAGVVALCVALLVAGALR